jgi:orotate phosphoribosyltransferase
VNIELIALLRELSWTPGRVTLASGRESDFYVDGRQTTLHARGARVVGDAVLRLIRALPRPVAGVGGMTLGADPIATATSLMSTFDGGPAIHAFLIRKEAKEHGTKRLVEGRRNLPDGSPVVIVEDVTTTGGSALRAADAARQDGLDPIGVVTVLDREEGARDTFAAADLPFWALVTRSELLAR